VLDTNAAQLRIKQLHDIGRVELGKGERMAKVSWMWGGKRYSGTLIPSRETKTHRFARTENGKIKKLPKKK
jgi:hypothetical protein